MRKTVASVLLVAFLVVLAGCSAKADAPWRLEKEGIAPYALTEREQYLLQSFNLDGNAQLISFQAPREAASLHINVYRLQADGSWGNLGGGGISIGADREPTDSLAGTFAMQLQENYAIDCIIRVNDGGKSSYTTDEVLLTEQIVGSMTGFLQEFQAIELDTEIPVALMVYDSGTSMKTYALQDYFEPSKFAQMDLVQVVTLEFSAQE